MLDTAVVMITCNKFNQAWDPFFTLFKKYWNDCPYKVYMITDYGKYEDELVNNITLGKDYKFSSNLKIGLQQIPENKIVYFQEDYFFTDKFDTERIKNYNSYINKYDISCIRLCPCPAGTKPWDVDDSLGIIEFGADYRISTQTAIWDKKFLNSLLIDGETGGDFEILGTRRTGADKLLLSVWREQTPTPYFITGLVRGVWLDGAIKLLEENGIDTSKINKVIK